MIEYDYRAVFVAQLCQRLAQAPKALLLLEPIERSRLSALRVQLGGAELEQPFEAKVPAPVREQDAITDPIDPRAERRLPLEGRQATEDLQRRELKHVFEIRRAAGQPLHLAIHELEKLALTQGGIWAARLVAVRQRST